MQSVNRNRPNNEIALQAELSRLIADRQQQISTGRRIDKPSQDPAAWTQISNVAKMQANNESWLRNIDRGLSIANQAEGAISQINLQLIRVNELLIQASSGAVSLENREIIAQEIYGIGITISESLNQKDAFGQTLFADTEPLKFPIDNQVYAQPAPSKSDFGNLAPLIGDIADAVRTGDDALRSSMLDQLKLQADLATNILGNHGSATTRLENGKIRLQDRQIDIAIYRSSLEDADVTQAIATMQKLLVNLEAAQATFARIEQSSLFDVIR